MRLVILLASLFSAALMVACGDSSTIANLQATIAAQQDVIDRQDARIEQLTATIAAGGGGTASATPQATAAPDATRAASGEREYVVQEGDSLSGIAAQFGISTDALAEANGITDPNSIRIGQRLVIPESG